MAWYFNVNSTKKSNVVGFPVVWEKIQEPENVINYNIREEQTIDDNSVTTANNQTTTGMAREIPWINCPKLIASTSIIWDLWWGKIAISEASSATAMSLNDPTALRNYTLTSASWDIYLDEDRPARLYSTWWTYMIVVEPYTANSNASITGYVFAYDTTNTKTYECGFSQDGWSTKKRSHVFVTTLEKWRHVRIQVTLGYSTTVYATVTFIKLA